MELVRCGRCAKQVPASSTYCRRCGCELAGAWGPPPPRPPRGSASSTIALAVVTGALLLTAINRAGPSDPAIEIHTSTPAGHAEWVSPAEPPDVNRPIQISVPD